MLRGCRADKELEAEKLKAEIEEAENSLKHLRRSNEELSEALKETPEDADFQQAIEENKGVIGRREDQIEELRDALKQLAITGIVPMPTHTDTQPVTTPPPSQQAQASEQSPGPDIERQEQEREHPEEQGVYL